RDLVLGLFHGDSGDVVDFLADLIIAEAVRAARQWTVVGGYVDPRAGGAEKLRLDRGRQPRHVIGRRGRIRVAFVDHDPAHVFENDAVVLLATARANIDHAGLATGILLQPDDLGRRGNRISDIDRGEELAIGIAEVGHRVE